MKKLVLIMLFIIVSIFTFTPIGVGALSLDDTVLTAAKTSNKSTDEIKGLNDKYNQDGITCQGSDSVLGDPKDSESVAWLLDQILTWMTIIGMLLVVVLSSIDFLSVVVKSDDEAMAKAARKFGLRLVLAVLLFFVPTITNAILDIFGLTSQSTCGLQQ